jgi:hypothetical protein
MVYPLIIVAFVACYLFVNGEFEDKNNFRSLSASDYKIRNEILNEVWHGDDPFSYADTKKFADNRYPHTNIMPVMIEAVIKLRNPTFWLEIGSMLGGSIIMTASKSKELGFYNMSIVSVDPFTGDVNMWAWDKALSTGGSVPGLRVQPGYTFLGLSEGRPRIYDKFRANVALAGHSDSVIPILCSSVVGMRLIRRLFDEHRISQLPQVIYLDSAHEEHETLVELKLAWKLLLESKAVLFGDDWSWLPVQNSLKKFVDNDEIQVDTVTLNDLASKVSGSQIIMGKILMVQNGQWLMIKA